VCFHNGKLLPGQFPRLVEDFLQDGPLAHVIEQSQGGVEPNIHHGQRRNRRIGAVPSNLQTVYCEQLK
jgi:hypothetical protein